MKPLILPYKVLKNGVEVKLQRNALSVLEHPTGNEEDFDHDYDNSSSGSDLGVKENDFGKFYYTIYLMKPQFHSYYYITLAFI